MADFPTIASDEDMDVVFVLADRHAPDARAAIAALLERAPIDWGLALEHEPPEPERRSYKWASTEPGGEENLVRCEPDDPARDSDWWTFQGIAPGEWEQRP